MTFCDIIISILSPKGIPQLSTFHCQLSTGAKRKQQFIVLFSPGEHIGISGVLCSQTAFPGIACTTLGYEVVLWNKSRIR